MVETGPVEKEERAGLQNWAPSPPSAIDCRVHRLALALRYRYSSIDRPALKSESHLVARHEEPPSDSGSGDLEMFV